MIVEGDLSIKKSMGIIKILQNFSDEILEQGIKTDERKIKKGKEQQYEKNYIFLKVKSQNTKISNRRIL